MARTLAMLIGVSLFVGACGPVTEPPPGTTVIEAKVINGTDHDVSLAIRTPVGEVRSATPPSAKANATTDVILYVPTDGDWALSVGGDDRFSKARLGDAVSKHCTLVVAVAIDGTSVDCEN